MSSIAGVITIALADDHPVVRQGLRALFDAEPHFSVIGEASDGIEAIRLADQVRPDVFIVDVAMPTVNGIEVTRQVTQRTPQTRVVILSMHGTEAYVAQSLKAGALGYVLKQSSSADLIAAIREVHAGRRYLSAPLSGQAIDDYLRHEHDQAFDPYDTLTTREREVFQLVATGHSSQQVADLLVISPRTVEIHRRNMMHKLKLKSQTELVRFAVKRGLFPV